MILNTPVKCDNVLLSYGTIEYGSGSVFSLFMPKAGSDLGEYLKHHEIDTANSMQNMASHMLCAAGLARGVAHLHSGIEEPGAPRVMAGPRVFIVPRVSAARR